MLTESLLSSNLIKSSGKVISVSSCYGKLYRIKEWLPELFEKCQEYEKITLADLPDLEKMVLKVAGEEGQIAA